ncbi:MAG TPA: Asp-tRNA(Asn)/Glu-tRNA(Gln) amidotransferase subunit GatB, partial [Candidatus Atribacteria bacterium]|nr:Asp-tRNA(Asn)/Glu-tRNA(Gln) amidotransferase subunit GatB [Candidatus Atribacteria bacterium]
PDLPKAYQISQYDIPIGVGGYISFVTKDGKEEKVNLVRIHMEEDAGKLIHEGNRSFVDYNRAGVPLLEIVTQPDIRSPEGARLFLTELRNIVRYLGVCDGNMEEGSLRCDANISVRPKGEKKLGTKVEIKNLNSFRSVKRALEYEAKRQIKVLESGEQLIQETRHFDESSGITVPMRSKEEASDYRYFPEPDLPPLILTEEFIGEIREHMPQVPEERRRKFREEFGLPLYDSYVLSSTKELGDYYEKAVSYYKSPKPLSNWIMGELLGYLNKEDIPIENSPIGPERIAKLVKLIDDGVITGKLGKEIFEKMMKDQRDPEVIMKEEGLTQIADEESLIDIVEEVIDKNPKSFNDYKKGKKNAFNFLIGQIMRETKGRANPQIVKKVLKEILDKRIKDE